jgi:UDP-N-acetylglucosamine diphosphorylase/glucosamine-1-phosphate N-acetyltransferase
MSGARLYLFDDASARRWAPFSLTRPIGELLFGCSTLRARTEHVLGIRCHGHVSRRALLGFDEEGAAPGVSLDQVARDHLVVFLSSRAVPDFQHIDLPDEAARITVGGIPAGWVVPPEAELPSELWIRDPGHDAGAAPELALGGIVLEHPWDLVARNADRIRADEPTMSGHGVVTPGVVVVGNGTVSLGEGTEIEAGVTLDTRKGPIVLDRDVRIEGPARLSGPLFVGSGTLVAGGAISTSSIGLNCRVRGEISDSVLVAYVNKAHEGYLGHALVGRWVNLGALTTNSDLKNNYGTVTVWTPDGDVDTEQIKIGCYLGDHVKTGIGTLLNTGTVVGAGSNIFGGAMPPVAVPPFSWGSGSDLTEYRLDKFLETAERVMARRDVTLTAGMRQVLEAAWSGTAGRRQK